MQASLVMFKADGTRRDFPLTKPRTVIGRTNECDLRIALSSVSRQHCEFLLQGDKIKLRDLGSSNGTFRNEARVQEAELAAGDEVGVGPVVFTVVIDGQPAKIEPVKTLVSKAEPKTAPAKGARPSAGKKIEEKDEDAVPAFVDEESNSPTVDLDDPIAALEAMGGEDDSTLPALDDDDKPKKKGK